MQSSRRHGRTGVDAPADKHSKNKVDELWQRGINFVSNISPIIAIGASGALAGMCAMSIWNKVNETLRPSAERLASGDKGISARQPFEGASFCALSYSFFLDSHLPLRTYFLTGFVHTTQSQRNDRDAEGER